jgi:hypothetical protein
MSTLSSVVDLEPQALGKVEVCKFLGIGPKILARMIAASRSGDEWLQFVSNHSGKPRLRVLFSVESARAAFCRLKRGEEPPLLPCESRARNRQIGKGV